jgi:hypothetical protein
MKLVYPNIKLTALLICLYTMNACDSFVDVDFPKSQLTSESVFRDYATADAALTDIYAKIRDKGMLTGLSSGLSNQLGNYTDELTAFGTASSPTLNFYNNSLLPSNAVILDYWNLAYNQIYAANSILEGIEKSTSISIDNKKKLKGETLFIRALLHFYLVNLFGPIPYIQTTDYKINSKVVRMSESDVYQNIIEDLDNSAALLPAAYSSTDRVRPNQYVAKALLARAYLYNGSYAEASNEASAILNRTDLFILEKNINQVFLISSKETIWQFKSAASGQNTKEAETFTILSAPPTVTALTPELVTSFGLRDVRRSSWIKQINQGTSVWYYSYKYKENNFTGTSVEYSILFRLAEQYLIRAEARVKQGDLLGAKEDLNHVRRRAGLSDTAAISKGEILQALLEERKWELFTEAGHRFFDLKRFDTVDQVLSVVKPGWNTTDRLFPIPQNELSANPNLLPQNAGY